MDESVPRNVGEEEKRMIVEGLVVQAGKGIKEKGVFKMLLDDFAGMCRKEVGREVLERFLR
jgi:hypothetical protein